MEPAAKAPNSFPAHVPKRWLKREAPSKEVMKNLRGDFQTSPLLLYLLAQRNISSLHDAYSFFLPSLDALHSPHLMKDMDLAVNRLQLAMQREERIVVYGDYDVDGTTSVALIYSFLRRIGATVDYYIPDRFVEGYGVTIEGITKAKEIGATLIVTLDCGIKSNVLISQAKSWGIDFIVCDHHMVGDSLPEAVAILNPKQPGCKYPYKDLSGCGVGFKLAEALSEHLNLHWQPSEYLDLVAISIAADLVPVMGENRIMAHHGLKRINADPRPGVQALLKLASVKKDIDFNDLIFRICPRINAAGRVSTGLLAVEMLTELSYDKARSIAMSINKKNMDRQAVDQNTTQAAFAMAEELVNPDAKTTVLYDSSWHQGVIGIVATRLIERFHKPTVLLTESNGIAVGSARSVPGFDLYQAIKACEDLLDQWGGHEAAAGLTLPIANIERFRERFEEVVSRSIQDAMLVPVLHFDEEIPLADITLPFAKNLARFGPFGPENPKPVFVSRRLSLYEPIRVLAGKHLSGLVMDEDGHLARIVGYGLAEHMRPSMEDVFDMCYTIELNHRARTQSGTLLTIKDLKIVGQYSSNIYDYPIGN